MRCFQRAKFGPRSICLIFSLFCSILYVYKTYITPSKSMTINNLETSYIDSKLAVWKTSTAHLPTTHKVATMAQDDILRFGKAKGKIIIGIVSCGERLNLTIVALKSAAILAKHHLHYVIMADKENGEAIKNKILEWPEHVLQRLSFEIHPISFPKGASGKEWINLFKPCACQRLFLPTLLRHIDSLIYIDTDVIFMHPIEDLWQYFTQMNSSQIAALVPEHEDFATGWYNRFARHPYYEPLGVNSGVMLMNLTRMRSFEWDTYLEPLLKEYKFKIVWGDQDMINIIFHFHSEKLLVLPCEWNYRPDHCMYSSVCKTAEENGVKALHGSRGVYQNEKQPVFKAIYNALEQYNLRSDITSGLLNPMKVYIAETANTNCGKVSAILTKSFEKTIKQMEVQKR